MDLKTIDPATVKAGKKVNVAIGTGWMGWELRQDGYWYTQSGEWTGYCNEERGAVPNHSGVVWSPSTNHAHAGEARRVADSGILTDVETIRHADGVTCHLLVGAFWYSGACPFTETNRNRAAAEALATCRAIAAAMTAKEG